MSGSSAEDLDTSVGTAAPPVARQCATCQRYDTRRHHVPLVGASHHVDCCRRACGRPSAARS